MSRERDIPVGGGVIARPGRRRKHLKPYTTLYESNFRDVAKELRKIAKAVEAGEYSQVNEAALILDCANGEYRVFGFGPHYNDASSTLMLFTMGECEAINAFYTAKELQTEEYKPTRLDDD